jgi:DNA-binding XRE family transcriptional regulator
MNKTQFIEAYERLGLTQGQVAELFECSIRTINAYANGSPIPKSVEYAFDPKAFQSALKLMVRVEHQ